MSCISYDRSYLINVNYPYFVLDLLIWHARARQLGLLPNRMQSVSKCILVVTLYCTLYSIKQCCLHGLAWLICNMQTSYITIAPHYSASRGSPHKIGSAAHWLMSGALDSVSALLLGPTCHMHWAGPHWATCMAFPIDLVLGLLAGTLTLIFFLVYKWVSLKAEEVAS